MSSIDGIMIDSITTIIIICALYTSSILIESECHLHMIVLAMIGNLLGVSQPSQHNWEFLANRNDKGLVLDTFWIPLQLVVHNGLIVTHSVHHVTFAIVSIFNWS